MRKFDIRRFEDKNFESAPSGFSFTEVNSWQCHVAGSQNLELPPLLLDDANKRLQPRLLHIDCDVRTSDFRSQDSALVQIRLGLHYISRNLGLHPVKRETAFDHRKNNTLRCL